MEPPDNNKLNNNKLNNNKLNNNKEDNDKIIDDDEINNNYKIISLAHKIHVEYHAPLLDAKTNHRIFRKLEKYIKWESNPVSYKRCTQTYGDSGGGYRIDFGDNIVERGPLPWSEVKCLLELKKLAEAITGETYNYCVAQRYPNGKIGIKAHKDRELNEKASICGFSFGATRTLKLTPPKFLKVEAIHLKLLSGSLYILKPPTNTYWMHEILKEPEITEPRISLTFRNN